ncbi:hypothetical protein Aca07nite_62450 [Actinoplanes capillaceus]|uniref:Uncharacterized protein n=1 Tax=Actinoplanes campanulatus TaxID=113559 RepID=A0ABQ3WRP6_9ACTN|nr:hypothetical protein [Actinoplanes capillaceus]GID48970.1 hypothetical protein Aca07nite_62450 [Actinoplanes capillaceus]
MSLFSAFGALAAVVLTGLNSAGGPLLVAMTPAEQLRVGGRLLAAVAPDVEQFTVGGPLFSPVPTRERLTAGGPRSSAVAPSIERLTVGGPGALVDADRLAIVRFDATAGQRLTVLAERRTLTAADNTDVIIRRIDEKVAEGTLLTTWSAASVDFTAPATAGYIIEVKPRVAEHGTVLVSLRGSTSGTLVPGGPPRKVTIGKPGDRAFLTFPSPAGRQLTLVARRGTLPRQEYTDLKVTTPAGETEVLGALGEDSDFRTLNFDTTAGGVHTIEVNPDTTHTGTLTVQLVGTVTARLTPGAPPSRVTLARAGERAYVTFRAKEAEQLRLTVRRGSLTTTGQTWVQLRTPLGLDAGSGTLTAEKPTASLAFSSSAGLYTIEIDPEDMDTGTLLLDLRRIP